ncbi:PAS domain S-box-containing protein [Sphingomonas insulae]|uniref:PAS fold-4 domain-containing protein n=1 Tax=Sphingomonas insulae TaxID=424800 RepID=A0ABN1HKU0_9SPHN|nr:PAS domain-containing protein [Sphingomonas insulae]NIJ30388.1 PAS domain S-box-containing protein [Sphingomonas insulae]
MYPAAGPIAHGMIGLDLQIADLDDAYRTLLGLPRAATPDRSALDVLHPDDRLAGERFLRRVWDEGTTLSATLRHLHADGRAIWVNLYVSRLGGDAGRRLVVTCRPLPPQGERPSTVEAQWQVARLLLQALDGGKRAFGDALIGNPATEILLIGYVAEAEARAVAAGEIAGRINVAWPLTRRWLAALIDAGFIEPEIGGPIGPDTPVRLSVRALAMLEAIFTALVAVVQGPLVPA